MDTTPTDPAEITRWHALQERLAAKVSRDPADLPSRPRVLALDVQYAGSVGHVGASLSRSGEGTRSWAARVPVEVDYVSGSFCFREGPPLLAMIEALHDEAFDLLLVDGHGLAHPRRFGAACYVGLASGLPTIGCAKRTLLRYEGELATGLGARSPIVHAGELVGWALRTRAKVKPVFASPGHRVSLDQTAEQVLALPGLYRVRDPLRDADHVARASATGKARRGWRDLGELPAVVPLFPA
jgi:deoxyribonuclease V